MTDHRAKYSSRSARAGNEDCLQAANAIRVVLTQLSDRMAQITRENSEFKTALGGLFGKPLKRVSAETEGIILVDTFPTSGKSLQKSDK